MMIRKYTEDAVLEKGERVGYALASVIIYDADGNRNEIAPGTKYIVSGDCEYFEYEGADVSPILNEEEDE